MPPLPERSLRFAARFRLYQFFIKISSGTNLVVHSLMREVHTRFDTDAPEHYLAAIVNFQKHVQLRLPHGKIRAELTAQFSDLFYIFNLRYHFDDNCVCFNRPHITWDSFRRGDGQSQSCLSFLAFYFRCAMVVTVNVVSYISKTEIGSLIASTHSGDRGQRRLPYRCLVVPDSSRLPGKYHRSRQRLRCRVMSNFTVYWALEKSLREFRGGIQYDCARGNKVKTSVSTRGQGPWPKDLLDAEHRMKTNICRSIFLCVMTEPAGLTRLPELIYTEARREAYGRMRQQGAL